MCLRLSSRCRRCRTERWRAPMTASRIPPEPVSFTTPIIDCEPPPVGITACPPPSPAALHRRTPRRLAAGRPASGAPRPIAAPRGGGVRRRGAAPRSGGRGPAQAHRATASARDARADRHGHRADASAAHRRRDAATGPGAHGRRRGGRRSRLAEVFATYTRADRPRVRGDRGGGSNVDRMTARRIVALQIG